LGLLLVELANVLDTAAVGAARPVDQVDGARGGEASQVGGHGAGDGLDDVADPGGGLEDGAERGVGAVHLLHRSGAVQRHSAAGAFDVRLHQDSGDDPELTSGLRVDVDLPEGLYGVQELGH